jgi:putative sterol carrier protein
MIPVLQGSNADSKEIRMPVAFPSEDWVKALMESINNSPSYAEAGQGWEYDVFFIVEPDGAVQSQIIYYMDLWHGHCRDAFEVNNQPERYKPVFRFSARAGIWQKVISGKLDPMQAMLTGQVKVKGPMTIIMRNVRAAKELVTCGTRVPTDFYV